MARIELWNGDICDLEVDAIVNAANMSLWMSTGVSGETKRAGGDAIEFAAVRQALPMPANVELDVREHAFLLASHLVGYSFVRIQGLTNILHGGQGMYMDRFVTTQWPGLVSSASRQSPFLRWVRESAAFRSTRRPA